MLYGMSALLAYEKNTGRNALDDFLTLDTDRVSVTLMTNMLYYGLWNGYRSERQEIDFDEFDVADWSTEPGVFAKAMDAFKQAFPTVSADASKKNNSKAKSAKT